MDLLIKELENRLSEQHLTLSLTDKAKDYLIDSGYDPVYGARPLKRYITHTVETKLARALIAGGIREKTQVNIDVKAGELVFSFV